MLNQDGAAQDFAMGAYVQASVSDQYLYHLNIKPNAQVLDVGCGDGSYSTKISQRIPEGVLIGIDKSENMLCLAKEKNTRYYNFTAHNMDVLDLDYKDQFDYITSFWCLHWCNNLQKAYANIYQALKKGGQLITVLPTGQDDFVNSFGVVKSADQFPCLRKFKTPIHYQKRAKLKSILKSLPFEMAEVREEDHIITLPSIDYFRRFVNSLDIFQGRVPADDIQPLNDALVAAYDNDCQLKHEGKYLFHLQVYIVTARK